MRSRNWILASALTAVSIAGLASDAKAQGYYRAYGYPVPYSRYAVPYTYNSVVPPSIHYAVPVYNPYIAPYYEYQNYRYSTPYNYGSYNYRYQSPSYYGPGGYSYNYWNGSHY